jgi:hypothetical protein
MPPETTAYLVLGLVASFGLLGLLIASFWSRFRSLKKDRALIEQLRSE